MTAQFGFVIVLAVLLSVAGASLALAADPPAADKAPGGAEAEFAALHKEYVAVYQPLWIESSKAWWEANITGSDEAFARKKATDGALVDLHSNKATFARLKALREAGQMRDPENKRLLDVMYRTFLPNQADPELLKRIVDLENDVEQMFNVHRSPVGGKDLTENEVRKILGDSHQSAEAEQAWKGYMAVGAKVDPKLRELVKLRNESARQLGYSNFRALQLAVNEIDDKDLARLFDELDELSRGPFAELKQRIDQTRARWFNVKIEELRPWHYGDLFFQEAPRLQELSLDDLFADQDLLVLARKYYAGIGLPVDDILGRSDLYEKPGKSPHAFCSCIDRVQDIRVLANLQPNRQWADTLLHELGHGVYDKYIAPDVPFVLHEAAHGITTEGVALMLGSMVMQEEWLTKVRGLEAEKAAPAVAAARESQRIEKLVFCRWAQVMVRFEEGMYANPDQNLAKLWWDLKNHYQLLTPPDDAGRPDYGAKNHIITTPVYYHNYMMGELFAAQLQHHIAGQVLGIADPAATAFVGQDKVGQFLRDKVFGPGRRYSWNELTKLATGEPLTARYFADRFIAGPKK